MYPEFEGGISTSESTFRYLNVEIAEVIDSGAAWFVDGSYLFKVWQGLRRPDKLDYLLLRKHLENKFQVKIADAYYFNADPDPPTAKTNAFHSALAYPPPGGPGLRVKLYWLQKRPLYWPQAWGGADRLCIRATSANMS